MSNTRLFDPRTLASTGRVQWSDPQWETVRALIAAGTSIQAIAALLDLAGAHPKQVAYFRGPIIVQVGGAEWDIPDRLTLAVRLDRFDAVREECLAGVIGELAVPSDLAAVLSSASLAAPLARAYTDVLVWAVAATASKHGGAMPDDVPPYERIHAAAESLARDIRRRVVAAGKRTSRLGRRPGGRAQRADLFRSHLL